MNKIFIILQLIVTLYCFGFTQSNEVYFENMPNTYWLNYSLVEGKEMVTLNEGRIFDTLYSSEYKLIFNEVISHDPLEILPVASIPFERGYSTLLCKYIPETQAWVAFQYKINNGSQNEACVIIINHEYEIIKRECIYLDLYSIDYTFNSTGEAFEIIATSNPPLKSILRIRYELAGQDSLSAFEVVNFNDYRPFFISSCIYLDTAQQYAIFEYPGISILDTNLNLVSRVPYAKSRLNDLGTIKKYNKKFLVHGALNQTPGTNLRYTGINLLTKDFNFIKGDTLGLRGEDTYPFYAHSLDFNTEELIVGGINKGPLSSNVFFTDRTYYLAKYDLDLNRIWYKQYGGDRSYVMQALHLLENQDILVYGYVIDPNDYTRKGYLAVIGKDGDLVSSTEVAFENDEVTIENPGKEDINLYNHSSFNYEVKLFGMNGNMILARQIAQGHNSFALPGIPPGQYPYQIFKGEKLVQTGIWTKIE